jgi:hypothetical protein
MLKTLQPSSVAFNGCVVQGGGAQSKNSCISPNAVRWVGTEAGAAPTPNWGSGFTGGGNPASDTFCPSESDTTLQNGDQWFYDPTSGIRTLAELQDVYHDTVGHNSFLMMDFAPTPEGLIAPDQVARCELHPTTPHAQCSSPRLILPLNARADKEFGDWMRGCYFGSGVAGKVEHIPGESSATQLLTFEGPRDVERLVIREDMSDGQAIRGWEIQGEMSNNGTWRVLATGTSVGNKWITLLPSNVSVTAIKSTVTASANPASPGTIRSTSGHFCTRAPKGAACTLRQNFQGDGVGKSSKYEWSRSVSECCAACTAVKSCAIFVFRPGRVNTCTLWEATGGNGKAVNGVVTGSPNRVASKMDDEDTEADIVTAKPHIVFCLVDDLGWNTVYNNDAVISPTIDSLAAKGVKLTSFYTYRYCSPTRASFLTGRLPYKLLNIRENLHSMASPDATDVRFTMLPKRLKEAQYWSIQIGKWHQGAASFSHTPVGRGFDESFGFLAGGEDHFSQVSAWCKFDTGTSHEGAADETTPPAEDHVTKDLHNGTCTVFPGTNDNSGHMRDIFVVDSPGVCCANCTATPGCKFFLCVNQSTGTNPNACRCLLKANDKGRAPWSGHLGTYGSVNQPLPGPPPPSPPPGLMTRLGATDYDNGETSPVMFGGWPLLLESISSCHPDHARNSVPEFFFCPSYLRIINLTNGHTVSNVSGSCNHTFGSALAVPAGDGRPETLYVFASRYARFQTPNAWCPRPKTKVVSECQNGTACVIDAWTTSDESLQTWTQTPALTPGFQAFNNDVVKLPPGAFSLGGGIGHVRYVMAVEHPGGPNGWACTMFATNASTPMSGWVAVPRVLPGAQDADLACPCIRYEENKFYVAGAARFINGIQSVDLLRSSDLKTWEPAHRSLVSPDRSKGSPELRAINASEFGLMTWQPDVEYPKGGRFGTVSTAFYKGGWNIAASDLDAVEIEGGYFPHPRGNKSVLVSWCVSPSVSQSVIQSVSHWHLSLSY